MRLQADILYMYTTICSCYNNEACGARVHFYIGGPRLTSAVMKLDEDLKLNRYALIGPGGEEGEGWWVGR